MPVHMMKCLHCHKWKKMRIGGYAYPLHYHLSATSEYEECLNCGVIEELPKRY